MAVFNAQGLPIQLLLQADKNFGNLAAMISPGVALTGRVTEVLADGKAIVNFRGIPVTAEMKGVSLSRGETINVVVQDLTGTPVFRMVPPAVSSLRTGTANLPTPEIVAGFDSQVSARLTALGLPRDVFHATIVHLLDAYGLPPTRESVVAVKDLALRLPQLLASSAAPPESQTPLPPSLSVSRMSATLPSGQSAQAFLPLPGTPAPARSWSAPAPAPAPFAPPPAGSAVPAPSVSPPPMAYPQVSVSLSQGYLLGRVLVQAAALLAQPSAPAPASSAQPAGATPAPPVAQPTAPPPIPGQAPAPATSGPAPAAPSPPLSATQLYAALESFRTTTASPVLREVVTQVQRALTATPGFQPPSPTPGTGLPSPQLPTGNGGAAPTPVATYGSLLVGPAPLPRTDPSRPAPVQPASAPPPPAPAAVIGAIGRALTTMSTAASTVSGDLARELTAPDFGSAASAHRLLALAPRVAQVVREVAPPARVATPLPAGTAPSSVAPPSALPIQPPPQRAAVESAPVDRSGSHELAGVLTGVLHEAVVATHAAPSAPPPASVNPPAGNMPPPAAPRILPAGPAPVRPAEIAEDASVTPVPSRAVALPQPRVPEAPPPLSPALPVPAADRETPEVQHQVVVNPPGRTAAGPVIEPETNVAAQVRGMPEPAPAPVNIPGILTALSHAAPLPQPQRSVPAAPVAVARDDATPTAPVATLSAQPISSDPEPITPAVVTRVLAGDVIQVKPLPAHEPAAPMPMEPVPMDAVTTPPASPQRPVPQAASTRTEPVRPAPQPEQPVAGGLAMPAVAPTTERNVPRMPAAVPPSLPEPPAGEPAPVPFRVMLQSATPPAPPDHGAWTAPDPGDPQAEFQAVPSRPQPQAPLPAQRPGAAAQPQTAAPQPAMPAQPAVMPQVLAAPAPAAPPSSPVQGPPAAPEVAVPLPGSPPPAPATGATPAPAANRVAPQVIETAVFMVARELPPTPESASAAHDFLFSEPRLPEAMQRLTEAAQGPALRQFPPALSAAVSRALDALAKVTVRPDDDALPQQLKTAVEHIGLDHEARLAASAVPSKTGLAASASRAGSAEPVPAREISTADRTAERADAGRVPDAPRSQPESTGLRPADEEPPAAAPTSSGSAAPVRPDAGPRSPSPAHPAPASAPPVRETLKAALLEVKRQADLAMATVQAPAARLELMNLRSAAHDGIQAVQAQQVGGVNAPNQPNHSTMVYVQIPLMLGAELRGGDIQVSWRKEKKGKKRDPRVPAQMTMQLETRSLGTVDVSMKMLGSALSLIFRVFDSEVQEFIGRELPGLVDRLTGFKFRVDQAECLLQNPVPAEAPPVRAVRPTTSLDLKA